MHAMVMRRYDMMMRPALAKGTILPHKQKAEGGDQSLRKHSLAGAGNGG